MIIRPILVAALAVAITLGCGGKEAPNPTTAEAAAKKVLDEEAAKVEAKVEPVKKEETKVEPVKKEEAKAEPVKKEEAKKEEVAAEPAKAAAPVGFKEYKSVPGNFRVEASGTAKEDETTADSVLGKVTYKNVMFALPDGALMVAWGDMPIEPEDEAMKKSMFDGGRDGMLKSVKGKLLDEKVIELDGMEGRQWLIEVDAGPQIGKITNRVRTFLKGKRNYILQGMHIATAPSTKADYFLDSFKLLD